MKSFLLALMLGSATLASAQNHNVSVGYHVTANGGSGLVPKDFFQTFLEHQVVTDSAVSAAVGESGSAFVNVEVGADYGLLKISGFGSATRVIASGGVGRGGRATLGRPANGQDMARFRDRLTVTSNRLPMLHPVQLRIALSATGFIAHTTGVGSATAAGYARFTVSNQAGSQYIEAYNTTSITEPKIQYGIINTYVGDTLTISGTLNASCEADAMTGGTGYTSSFNFTTVASFGIVNLEPRATVISETSYKYPGPRYGR